MKLEPSRIRRAAPALAATLALALAGCGGSDSGSSDSDSSATPKPSNDFASLSGSEIVRAGLKDISGVKAVRLKGHLIIDDGQVTFDFRTGPDGRCGGTMGIGGGQAQIVATKKAAFLKGNDAFWKEQAGAKAAQIQAMLAGRWAKTPPSDQITALCRIGEGLIDEVSAGKIDDAEVGEVSQLDGDDVVSVTTGSGNDSYRLLVNVEAPHYLRKLISLTPGDEGELEFSGFGVKTPVDVPAAGEYVVLD